MPDNRTSRFSSSIWLTAGLLAALIIVFAIYIHLHGQIDRARDRQHASFLLADELRKSSDNLTRMARIYVVTGDPIYKTYYQDILDIRNGKSPRPHGYQKIYWDFVLADGKPLHHGSDQPAALLDLMRQAGFTAEEFRKLEEAKTNSDALSTIELNAMKLTESSAPDAEADRARARLMLHDARYHQAKAAIMKPIDEFYALMEKRTTDAIMSSEANATAALYLFAALGFLLLLMLWRTYTSLQKIMGGSVDETHALIARIGSGDFASPVPVAQGMEDSVLGWLSETRIKLRELDAERKRSEDALQQSDTRLRLLLNTVAEGIYGVDTQGNCTFINPAGLHLLGYQQEAELIGMNMHIMTHHTRADGTPHPRAECRLFLGMQSGNDLHLDDELFWRKNGSSFSVECWTRMIRRDGEISGAVITFLDISERKRIEQELRIAATAFDSQEAMIITDANHVILKINQAFSRITGYSTEEAIGRSPALLKSGHHDSEFYRTMFECLERDKHWQGEIWNQRKDGKVIPEWLTITVLTGGDGKVSHYIASYSDISQLKQAEEELRKHRDHLQELVNEQIAGLKRSKEAAERASLSKSEFLANMSHELRTPMHAIISFSEIGERMAESAPAEKLRGYFQRIQQSGERLLRLINDLLDLSRLEAGKLVLNLRQDDLHILLKDALTELELLASSKRLNIVMQAPSCDTITRVDAKSFRQVVSNLVANAIKFTPACGTITLRLLPAELPLGRRAHESGMRPAITLEVSDTGIGIPEDELESVFDKFVQSSKTSTGAGGTGLGLAICREIATAHRGIISARNNPAGGATFTFTLPLLK